MNEDQQFYEALKLTPDDEHLRLVFADWLEERSDPRAPWVRNQAYAPWLTPAAEEPFSKQIAALRRVETRTEAKRALLDGGLPAVGAMVAALARESVESFVDSGYSNLLHQSKIIPVLKTVVQKSDRLAPLVDSLRSSSKPKRRKAVVAVRELGPAALALVPPLIYRLPKADKVECGLILDALKAFGPHVPAAVVCAYTSFDAPNRELLRIIREQGPVEVLVHLLVAEIGLSNGVYRDEVIATLNNFGMYAFPALLTAISIGYGKCRKSLREICVDWAPNIVPALVEVINDDRYSYDIRCGVVDKLGAIAHADKLGSAAQHREAEAAVTAALASPSDELRRTAVIALKEFKAIGSGTIDGLVKQLANRETNIAAMSTLATKGDAARVAIPKVRKLLSDDNTFAVTAAVHFLILFDDEQSHDRILDMFDTELNILTRARMVGTFGYYASKCDVDEFTYTEFMHTFLQRILQDPAEVLQYEAIRELHLVYRVAPDKALNLLRIALAHDNPRVREWVLDDTKGQPAYLKDLLPELQEMRDTEPEELLREKVARVLKNHGL